MNSMLASLPVSRIASYGWGGLFCLRAGFCPGFLLLCFFCGLGAFVLLVAVGFCAGWLFWLSAWVLLVFFGGSSPPPPPPPRTISSSSVPAVAFGGRTFANASRPTGKGTPCVACAVARGVGPQSQGITVVARCRLGTQHTARNNECQCRHQKQGRSVCR